MLLSNGLNGPPWGIPISVRSNIPFAITPAFRFNTTLNQNTHESLRQRIVMNYHMGGLTKEEGRLYIVKKLDGAGARQTVFNDNAMEAILNAANGTARMINKICNRSLMIGASQSSNIIDAETVRKAVDDTQLG